MYPTAAGHVFMMNHKLTRKLRACVPKQERRCGDKVNVRSCMSISLDEKINAGCHENLKRLRQCWVDGVDQCVSSGGELPISSFTGCYGKYNQSEGPECVKDFEAVCKSTRVHSTKLHRLRMSTVEELILRIPNIYIIYYVRDPRGIYKSRKGLYDVPPFAKLCEHMEEDHDVYDMLKAKYPEVFLQVKYEHLASDPQGKTKQIYNHIGLDIPQEVTSFLNEPPKNKKRGQKEGPHSVHRSNSTYTASAWRDTLSETLLAEANTACKTVLDKLDYIT